MKLSLYVYFGKAKYYIVLCIIFTKQIFSSVSLERSSISKKKGHAVAFCESETACNGDYTTLKTAPKDLTLLKLTTKFSSAIVRYKKTISPFGNTPPAQNSEEGGTIDFVANSGDAGF